jgi:tetratricopeptide (TPR) repeat protein
MEAAQELKVVTRELRAIVLLTGVAVAAFFLTQTVARANHQRRQADAGVWYERGHRFLVAGDAGQAVPALRRAVALNPDGLRCRLDLAAGLSGTGAYGEARRLLLDVRQTSPQDVGVNLALARLEAAHGDSATAAGYYQVALNQMWRPQDVGTRYQVRSELARFLLSRGQRSRSLSEVILLAADAPDRPEARADVGRLFLDAGDPARALASFDEAGAPTQSDPAIRLAAGQAAFALGDYQRAHRYLRGATALSVATDLDAVVELVLSTDPLVPRLSSVERERRLRAGLQRARQRLAHCATVADGATLRDDLDRFESAIASRARNAPPIGDLLDDGVELVGRVEAAAGSCTPPGAFDRALVLIAKRHEAR